MQRLENLILTNNKVKNKQLKDLAQIDNLSHCKVLKRLSLLNNFVTSLPNYRLYIIFKIPSLTVLDFQKVKLKVSLI
jgi:U2 small nuclear ribonucleoprotein A'